MFGDGVRGGSTLGVVIPGVATGIVFLVVLEVTICEVVLEVSIGEVVATEDEDTCIYTTLPFGSVIVSRGSVTK